MYSTVYSTSTQLSSPMSVRVNMSEYSSKAHLLLDLLKLRHSLLLHLPVLRHSLLQQAGLSLPGRLVMLLLLLHRGERGGASQALSNAAKCCSLAS